MAKNHYTSDRYHNFVGFEISQGLLERVFPKVYGIKFEDVVDDEDLHPQAYSRKGLHKMASSG